MRKVIRIWIIFGNRRLVVWIEDRTAWKIRQKHVNLDRLNSESVRLQRKDENRVWERHDWRIWGIQNKACGSCKIVKDGKLLLRKSESVTLALKILEMTARNQRFVEISIIFLSYLWYLWEKVKFNRIFSRNDKYIEYQEEENVISKRSGFKFDNGHLFGS